MHDPSPPPSATHCDADWLGGLVASSTTRVGNLAFSDPQLESSRSSNAIQGRGLPPPLSTLYVSKLRRLRYVWCNSQKRHPLRIPLRASRSTPVCSRWLLACARHTRVDPHLRLKEQYHSRAAVLRSRFPPDPAHSFGRTWEQGPLGVISHTRDGRWPLLRCPSPTFSMH
jgi:hypothetical protein